MRDLIDQINRIGSVQDLDEARGLSARKQGEQFQRVGSNDDADIITFQSLDFFPPEGSYDSMEQMMQAYQQVATKVNPRPEAVNRPNARTRAFGLVKFDTAVGPRWLVKFAEKINPTREKNTFWQTDDIPGGFSQVGARGAKEKRGYKPSDVLTEFKSQTPDSIARQVYAKFGRDSAEGRAMQIFLRSNKFPIIIPGEGIDFTAFRDYFCEMLQPIALIRGMPVSGNADQAAQLFMKGDYSDCVVSFNEGVSGELYDSLLVNQAGRQIKLSSKGAKGAMASVINLLKSARELKAAGIDLLEQYRDVIKILETIDRGNHWTGPLELAVNLGMITDRESRQVLEMRDQPKGTDIDDIPGLTNNLRRIYKERSAKDPEQVVPLEHMVASIAYKVVNEINLNTNFSEAAADILNNSAFVQMYTEAAQKGSDIIIKGFRTVWPSKLFTEVTLEAQKSYSSTASSGGKLVFNINKDPKKVANQDDTSGTDPGDDKNVADLIPGSSGSADIDSRERRTSIRARRDSEDDSKTLGRARR